MFLSQECIRRWSLWMVDWM